MSDRRPEKLKQRDLIAFVRCNPSLRTLAIALRNPVTWPPKFSWFYGNCKQCALGLAYQLWRLEGLTNIDTATGAIQEAFGMPRTLAARIFLGLGPHRTIFSTDVTPEMVADEIDKYLASQDSA